MKGLIFVVLLSVTIFVASASEAPQAKCGGGCVLSSQCASWAGNNDCRCSWFTCGLVFADQPEMRDVEQFEAFIKEYSGNPRMLASAAKALKNKV